MSTTLVESKPVAVNTDLRMKRIRKLRASAKSARSEYLVLVEQIKDLRAKADVLRESYQKDRAKANEMLEALQAVCPHSSKVFKHDKEKPWVLHEVCQDCLKYFSTSAGGHVAEPTVVVEPVVESVVESVVEPSATCEKIEESDPRVQELRKQLPELMLNCWTSNTEFRMFAQRAFNLHGDGMEYFPFLDLLCAAMRVSRFATAIRGGTTMRQFMAIYYKQVNDRMWDNAPTERCLRELQTILGLRVKRAVRHRVMLRSLSSRSDWSTVK